MVRIIKQAIAERQAILAEGGLFSIVLISCMIYFFLSGALQPF